MDELLARVRALARRKAAKTQDVTRYRDVEIEPTGFVVRKAGEAIDFTPKLFNLLLTLVVGSGRVLTRGELYERLYGWSSEAESNTLDVYISQIRRKLGSDLIKTVRGVGYIVPRE